MRYRGEDEPSWAQVSHLVVWTPGGLMRFGVAETAATSVDTSTVLRSPVCGARQLWPDRVVAITEEGVASLLEPPVAGRLVCFDPAAPEEMVELGAATAWFPSFDGAGVWRVLQRGGGTLAMLDPHGGVFETALIGLDGRERSEVVTFADGNRPVAATGDGLIVEVPAPSDRPYPRGVGEGLRTLMGGLTTDLVAADQVTGRLGGHLSDYTRVVCAGSGGVALVANSDPNVAVRPTEVIDLQTGQVARSAIAQLRWWPLTHSQPLSLGDSDVAALVRQVARRDILQGPRRLVVRDVFGGDRVEVSLAIPPQERSGRPEDLLRPEQVFLWIGDTLVFTEVTNGGVRIAAWSARSGATTRFQPEFESGARPVGGSLV